MHLLSKLIRKLPSPEQKALFFGLKSNRLQRETKTSLKASYWNLPVTPFHTTPQKVRGLGGNENRHLFSGEKGLFQTGLESVLDNGGNRYLPGSQPTFSTYR
jgi:hypothetical protein